MFSMPSVDVIMYLKHSCVSLVLHYSMAQYMDMKENLNTSVISKTTCLLFFDCKILRADRYQHLEVIAAS